MAKASVEQVREKLLIVAETMLDRAISEAGDMTALSFSEKVKATEVAIAAFAAATAPRTIDPPPDGGRLVGRVPARTYGDPPPDPG